MHASAFSLAISIPTILPCCAILPFPSLLVRALTPMQLCGLKEAPDLSLALPQGLPLVVTGSGPATGGCCSRPPVRIHSQISGTQGWRAPEGEPGDGLAGGDTLTRPWAAPFGHPLPHCGRGLANLARL